jgi:hypothetical protein
MRADLGSRPYGRTIRWQKIARSTRDRHYRLSPSFQLTGAG